jgi:hypothetical protein
MLQGGGTQLLAGNGTTWNAPAGAIVYLDSQGAIPLLFTRFTCRMEPPIEL